MSVGGSIFSAVAIRNSDLGVFELMWKPGATRKSRVTLVCAARSAVTRGTAAIVTDGPFPDWAIAAPARSSVTRNPEICLGKIMTVQSQENTSKYTKNRAKFYCLGWLS